jgi:hypothetical protein
LAAKERSIFSAQSVFSSMASPACWAAANSSNGVSISEPSGPRASAS